MASICNSKFMFTPLGVKLGHLMSVSTLFYFLLTPKCNHNQFIMRISPWKTFKTFKINLSWSSAELSLLITMFDRYLLWFSLYLSHSLWYPWDNLESGPGWPSWPQLTQTDPGWPQLNLLTWLTHWSQLTLAVPGLTQLPEKQAAWKTGCLIDLLIDWLIDWLNNWY